MPSHEIFRRIPQDARDLLRAFSALDVRYLVVGAHALGYWAQPRATGDFDLFIDPTKANAVRVWKALEEFGAPLFDLTVEDLSRPGVVFQMGVPPFRIDLATELTGITFDEAWEGHGVVKAGEIEIPIIGRAAMIRNKRLTGRPKDLLDLLIMGEE